MRDSTHSKHWRRIETLPPMGGNHVAIERPTTGRPGDPWYGYWVNVGTLDQYTTRDLRTRGVYHGPYPTLERAREVAERLRSAED